MSIDYDALMSREFPVVTHSYSERDAMFYALGIGVGFDPLDDRQIDPVIMICRNR